MSNPADDFFSGGAPAVKFENVNDFVKGIVDEYEVSQQTDYETQKPKFYDDDPAKPMMQLVVTLSKASGPAAVKVDDDGCARLFIKGQMRDAVGKAVKASGQSLAAGGELTVLHNGLKPHDNPRLNNIKLFEAKYVPGAANTAAANEFVGGSDEGGTPSEKPAAAPSKSIDDIV